MFAAQRGFVRRIKTLLDAGAFIDAKDNRGQTALTYAALGYSGSVAIRFLVAAGLGVEDANDDGQTPLMLAAQLLSADAVSQLLEAGAGPSVNKKDKVGRTALMYAVSQAVYQVPPDVVTLLIGAGANVNEADESGQTVLMLALRGRSLQSIKKLLESGARVNAQDKQGLTALMHAIVCRVCGSENEMAEQVRVLFEAGTDVRIKDNQGRTALMLAKQADIKSIISLLEERRR